MDKSTPRPWTAYARGIYAGPDRERLVAKVVGRIAFTPYTPEQAREREQAADANVRLIVRAVNAHDDAVAILRDILKHADVTADDNPFGATLDRARALIASLDAGR